MHCRDHAVQLHRAREEFEAAGAELVLIGQATPRQAAAFRRKTKIDLPVLADEERRTYKLAGLRRGSLTQLVGARSVLTGVKHGARSGVVQGRIVGDAAQLGGAIVVAPGGEVVFEHRSRHAGDTIEADELLEAVR
ncbi:MAG TPA: peroxiredoxin-like family protein [Solirubrobacteraceae bacterium]|nr:peroxiredoxin-like family protein [Solirubrobacteraceae bacterium]